MCVCVCGDNRLCAVKDVRVWPRRRRHARRDLSPLKRGEKNDFVKRTAVSRGVLRWKNRRSKSSADTREHGQRAARQ